MGNVITRDFITNASRYLFDFNQCRAEGCWLQFDTDKDDWYFGAWVHPAGCETVTYTEGDSPRELRQLREARG